MKPKNKFQQQVIEASGKLSKLTDKQIQWGYDNAIEYIGRRTNKGIITCSRCNHSWKGTSYLIDTLDDCHCPNCKTPLNLQTMQKRVFETSAYQTIITTCKGFQVLRTIMYKCVFKIGEQAKYTHSEVMQRWIAPNGKYCTFARLRQTMGTMYYDSWIFHSPLELRQENEVYNRIYIGKVYPNQRILPELKRTGYRKDFFGLKPLQLFTTLLSDNKAETLLKAGYIQLLNRIMDTGWQKNIDSYWNSIRICIRNQYKIKDAILWCDYIDLLHFFGKDLHNSKYVCPQDLKKEHDRYVAKKAKADAQLELHKQLEKENDFKACKEKFFGLIFSDDTLQIRVLESVQDIINEGKIMHHCVGSYHSKKDSLILSACIGEKHIETIEVSLSQLKVIQSRGICNQNTEYHNQIINLVESNLSLIEQRLTA